LLATHKAIPGHFPGPIYGHNKLGKRLNHSGGSKAHSNRWPQIARMSFVLPNSACDQSH